MKYLTLTSLAFVFMGCGGAANDLSREEAWTAAQGVTASQSEIGADDNDAAFITTSITVDTEVPCPQGGSILLSGSMEYDQVEFDFEIGGDTTTTGGYSMVVDASYGSCATGDLTIDGGISIDVSGSYAAQSETTARVVGSAYFSGRLNGSCDLDYTVQTSYSASGVASFEFEGSICGYDLDELEAEYAFDDA